MATKIVRLPIIFLIIFSLVALPSRQIAVADNQSPGHLKTSGQSSTPDKPYQTYLPLVNARLGNLYYVSPSGNDHNPGTFSQPFQTLDKAASKVEPGDMVYLRGGIYYEAVRFTTSGTSVHPIKILAYGNEKPIIDGGGTIPGAGSGLLSISGDYVYASGIEVRNSAYDGIQVLGNYDIVSYMFVHHCQKKGIFISSGHASLVENNLVWWNSTANEYGGGTSYSSGITAGRNGVSYAIIRRNTVWENWGQGINTYEADHTVIEDNIVHDSFSGNIYIHDATNILCQRNFFYTNPASVVYPYGDHLGIMMGDERTIPTTNVTIVNNIGVGNEWNYSLSAGTNIINNVLIANNTFVNGIINGGVRFKGNHQNIRFINNIVEQDGDLPAIVIEAGFSIYFSHNLWSKIPPQEAFGVGDIINDPLLSHAGDQYSPRWYSLSLNSPANGAALTLPEVTDDFFSNSREVPPDIGADEFFPSP